MKIQDDKDQKLRKLEDEEWREIPYTDKHYQVSNFGRVKSFCYDCVNGRINRPGVIKGFYNVSLRVNGKKKSFLVHKLAAEIFIPKDNQMLSVVIHLDWNKTSNHKSNLQWMTREESYKRIHKVLQESKRKAGKVVTSSKLSSGDVAALKGMLQKGVRQNVIVKQFAVSEM